MESIAISEVSANIHALDTIAVALTTDAPGDVFATAFDKRQGFTLVLAEKAFGDSLLKTIGLPVPLVKAITASATEDASDVLPFLLSRCRTNVEKRITKMHDAVTAFSGVILEAVLRFAKGEFPNSDQYRKGRYSDDEPSSPQTMCDLLTDTMAKARVFNSGDTNLSAEFHIELAMIALILQESRLARCLRDPTSRVYRPRKAQAGTAELLSYQGLPVLSRHQQADRACKVLFPM